MSLMQASQVIGTAKVVSKGGIVIVAGVFRLKVSKCEFKCSHHPWIPRTCTLPRFEIERVRQLVRVEIT